MKKRTQVFFSDFVDDFRSVRPNNFSYAGLKALFDYLEDFENSTGVEIELDVIALCTEFSEYGNFEEFRADYPKFRNMDEVSRVTEVIEFDGGFIVRVF